MLTSRRLPSNPVPTAQAMERYCLLSSLDRSTRPSSILSRFPTNRILTLTCWASLRWCAQEPPQIVTPGTTFGLAANVTNECAKESVYAGFFRLFRLTDQCQRVNWTRWRSRDPASVIHCAESMFPSPWAPSPRLGTRQWPSSTRLDSEAPLSFNLCLWAMPASIRWIQLRFMGVWANPRRPC